MKILITGGSGLLGTHLQHELINRRDIKLDIPSHSLFDVTDLQAVREYLDYSKPDTLIHCAAVAKFKIVDKIPAKAIETNIVGTSNITIACMERNIRLIYISTDHVFDGKKGNYHINDKINPISKYAKTKAAGELAVRIYDNSLSIRTSFCDVKFPFDTGYIDKWTSQDYVDNIAPKIIEKALSDEIGICNVGHTRRSFYHLAKDRHGDTIKIGSIEDFKSNIHPILVDTSLKV
jgi:dTDP-4-dehydrorhamnose reductase